FTQADDVQDNQIYPTMTCSSSLPQGVRYVTGDSGYDDDHKLYNLSIDRRGFELVCQYQKYTTILQVTDCN
ncbi:MAG: hypothetical protein WBL88_02755, partial [Nitrososphaeraceae archaeon]